MSHNNAENLKMMIERASIMLSLEWNENPRVDAMILLAHAIDIHDYTEMFIRGFDKINLSERYIDKFESYINRRKAGEPIAYIINRKPFWKNDFYINSDVLIPRPESELLVEYVINISDVVLSGGKSSICDVLELGVGSGCVLISVLNELHAMALQRQNDIKVRGVGVDISDGALEVARCNVENILFLPQNVTLLKGNWFDTENLYHKFDLIISNPPYIPFFEWYKLSKEVKDFEPQISLTDMKDGLEAYRVISANAKQFLKDKGLIIVEVSYNRATDVISIFENEGFEVKDIVIDLCNIERVVSFMRICVDN
ncbi:peptide chain release factor N(5)-glutamine methyltransferase [Candidatus Fokinia crypta]|uniref:Release factor glutamine methyltransferase n=1 Tax=Candidatus Fokinia crypta TaxID=1920990 RepID=A0ABZ0USV9_9RICK|nr:peptide chain release factor N(5)-glutamine methyltransferase [Candidatus Fokinia cryptica]WPX98114.1 Release factor glutamine methyltransferase [Candidatus Fokinia cryptica]